MLPAADGPRCWPRRATRPYLLFSLAWSDVPYREVVCNKQRGLQRFIRCGVMNGCCQPLQLHWYSNSMMKHPSHSNYTRGQCAAVSAVEAFASQEEPNAAGHLLYLWGWPGTVFARICCRPCLPSHWAEVGDRPGRLYLPWPTFSTTVTDSAGRHGAIRICLCLISWMHLVGDAAWEEALVVICIPFAW